MHASAPSHNGRTPSDSRSFRSRRFRYSAAVLAVVLATGLRIAFNPVWLYRVPFLLFIPAILTAAWYGGIGPGLVATLLSSIMVTALWLPTVFSASVEGAVDLLGLGLFMLTGLMISALNEQLLRAKRTAEAHNRRLEREVHERRRVEDALRESERQLLYALEATSEGLWDWNIRTGEVHFSRRWIESLGYAPDEVTHHISFWEQLVHPDDMPSLRRALDDHFAGRTPVHMSENRLRKRTGEYRWNLGRGKVVEWDADGKPVRMVGTDTDITDRKQAEEQIRASLLEKEVLLKEIHHRVKNNLQIVSSLLSLQNAAIGDPKLSGSFQESQDRIRSMALVHEHLYRSEHLARIDVKTYLESLVGSIRDTYPAPGRITFDIQAPSLELGIDTAIPCGLLVNELVTNALKHAFAGREQGRVTIRMAKEPEGRVALIVQDDGLGLPEHVRVDRADTLGLRLVDALTHQLGAEMRIHRQGGTTFHVTFEDTGRSENKPAAAAQA